MAVQLLAITNYPHPSLAAPQPHQPKLPTLLHNRQNKTKPTFALKNKTAAVCLTSKNLQLAINNLAYITRHVKVLGVEFSNIEVKLKRGWRKRRIRLESLKLYVV